MSEPDPKPPKKIVRPRIHCKYCGAQLKRDTVGKYCPTRNCQWQHGIPKSEEKMP